MNKKLQIRNSTAEFLIFTAQSGEESIEVRYEDETIWLTQKLMAELFQKDVRTISEHLRNIYEEGELLSESTIRKFRIIQKGIKPKFCTGTHFCSSVIRIFLITPSVIKNHIGSLDYIYSAIRKFRNTASDSKKYSTRFYNLNAIISVGYRVNSIRATLDRVVKQVKQIEDEGN